MKRIGSKLLAGINALLIAAAFLAADAAAAARRPKHGGTLRVELLTAKVSLDPREWNAGAEEFAEGAKLAALVFDRLITLDNYGRFQPQLATVWTHDAAFKRWQFTIRSGVEFSDGTPLTAHEAAIGLRMILPASRQMSVAGDAIVIQSAEPMPDLLEELASGPNFVFHVQQDGTLLGTGAFVKDGIWQVGQGEAAHTRLLFRANSQCWAGEPYAYAVEVTLGVPALRQLYDLQLGKADLIELTPDLMHRAAQAGLRTWTSSPVQLFALQFDDQQPATQEAQLREAVSLLLDRATMAGVLLQKQAEPTAGLLPQWLSGYAFLFSVEPNRTRAKELREALPANAASVAVPLRLRLDAPGEIAGLLAQRVAVNAGQSKIVIQVLNRTVSDNTGPAKEATAELHLVTWRYGSLATRKEFDSMIAGLGMHEEAAPATAIDEGIAFGSEELYQRERRVLEERKILPLVAIPEFVGLSSAVHDWMPSPWGDWRLADVWVDHPEEDLPTLKRHAETNPAPGPAVPPGATP